jgi:hypothetical protein
MQALRDFPPTFSDGRKNASTSLVLSLSEMVGASGSESSNAGGSSALGAAAAGFSVIHKLKLEWTWIERRVRISY